MSTVRPEMHGLSYILGFPTQDEMKLKMDKALADQLSRIFQTTFECDFVETGFVQ